MSKNFLNAQRSVKLATRNINWSLKSVNLIIVNYAETTNKYLSNDRNFLFNFSIIIYVWGWVQISFCSPPKILRRPGVFTREDFHSVEQVAKVSKPHTFRPVRTESDRWRPIREEILRPRVNKYFSNKSIRYGEVCRILFLLLSLSLFSLFSSFSLHSAFLFFLFFCILPRTNVDANLYLAPLSIHWPHIPAKKYRSRGGPFSGNNTI